MTGLWAMVVIEVRTLLRDPTMMIGLVVLVFSIAVVHPVLAWVEARPPAAPEPVETAPVRCDRDGPPVPIRVIGEWPAGVPFAPLVPAAEAPVTVRVSTADVPVLTVEATDGSERVVEKCLREALVTARAARMAALGLHVAPEVLLDLEESGEPIPPEPEYPDGSVFGTLIALLAMVLAGSFAIEAVPRRRASGLLEQLRSTQTREEELVAGWVIAITALTTTTLVGCGVVYVAAGAWFGRPEPVLPAVHALPFTALVAALSVASSLRAADIQAASLRWFGVAFAVTISVGAAFAVWDRPWLAAVIPLGGSTLASMGWLGPWAWLADAAALVWTGLLVVGCSRSLRGEETSTAGADHELLRRARGNYLPEVLVLSAMGLSCAVVAGAGVFRGNLWFGMVFGFGLLMLTPSLLAHLILGLPRSELLPLPAPRARDLLLSVPMTVGLVALAVPILAATLAVAPENEVIDQFSATITDLVSGPLATLAIGLVPAVCEEFLYRGVILGLLMRSGRPWLANLGQALAFALAHIVSIRLPWTFVLGLFLGAIRQRTGSLWPCMALHLVFNVTVASLPSEPAHAADLVWALPFVLFLGVMPLYGRARAAPVSG